MNEQIIDPVVFEEMRELLDDALSAFIETYLDNSNKLLENINLALADGDLESLYNNAHQLKGGSGSIGAMQVFQLSKEIEEKSRGGEADGLDGLVDELHSSYAQAAAELKQHL